MRTLPSLNRLNCLSFRRRYREAFSGLLYFKLTLQALALPEDQPEAEQLSEAEMEAFLLKLLQGTADFARREARFLNALGDQCTLRAWRVAELMRILDVFDETSGVAAHADLSENVRRTWLTLRGKLIRVKADVVRLHIFF